MGQITEQAKTGYHHGYQSKKHHHCQPIPIHFFSPLGSAPLRFPILSLPG